MCGLVGVAGNMDARDEAIIRQMLHFDYFRGPDSVGLASVRHNGDVKIAKTIAPPTEFFDMQRFKDTVSGFHSHALIGHNRLATKGKVNASNAHPFQYGDITGAHNGTLTQASWKALEAVVGDTYDVDSQALIACIDKIGLKETVKLLEGAWAITYFDQIDNTLNFIRNKERPLWYAYSKDLKRIFWASAWPIIQAAVTMGSPTTELYKDEATGYQFWQIDEDWHFKWDVGKLANGSDTLPKPKVSEMKGKEAPAVDYSQYYKDDDPFGRDHRGKTGGTGKSMTTTFRSKKEPTVIHLLGIPEDPFAGFMDRDKFEDIAKDGCSWCSATVDWGDAGCTIFEREGIILCPECSQGDTGTTRVYVKNMQSNLNL